MELQVLLHEFSHRSKQNVSDKGFYTMWSTCSYEKSVCTWLYVSIAKKEFSLSIKEPKNLVMRLYSDKIETLQLWIDTQSNAGETK